MKAFKALSLVEGISLLLLVFLTLPLQYIFGLSGPLFFVGMAQGALLLCYIVSSLVVSYKYNWPASYCLLVFIAGVIPFGFLLINKKLKQADGPALLNDAS